MEEDERWSTVSFRIGSESMTSAEISRFLSTEPTSSYEKGTPVSKRNPNSPLRKNAVWLLDSGLPDDQPLEAHITKLVEYIEGKHGLIKELPSECEINLFCGFSSGDGQGGFVLDADLLKRLAFLEIDLVLNLYPPTPIDSDGVPP